jgi:hypothetical protein
MPLLFLVVLLAGPIVPMARAQSFGPPVPTELVLALLDREGNVRFTFSSYYAHWENPFRVTVGGFSNALHQRVSRQVRVVPSTPSSPLFEGSYVVSRRWSVGFWYNPIRGERLRQTVDVLDVSAPLDFDRDAELADLHVTYYGLRGTSAQLGYYHERDTLHDRINQTVIKKTLGSLNLWLTQRLDVFLRDRLTNDRLNVHLVPFVSLGYHASSDLNHAASVLTGIAVTFNEKISLSTSVWLFDLSNTATRITGGLVILF